MGKTDPRVDAIIAKAAPFAKPVLTEIRKRVHAACPDVEETIKWRMPFFMYKGILCMMATFKAHCAFGFWGPTWRQASEEKESHGQFGRIESVADLPGKAEFARRVKKAMALNAAGVKAPAKKRVPAKKRPPLKVPAALSAALQRNARALAAFEGFSYSHRKEYIQWIAEAKREETREKRVLQAIEMLADGKSRNWKYENC